MDIRDLPTVTIDGEDAKDLDDAVSLTKRNIYHLGVHIADVTHYVRKGRHLIGSIKRGTSVYLVDRVLPMLPHFPMVYALLIRVDRLALSCYMDIDVKEML